MKIYQKLFLLQQEIGAIVKKNENAFFKKKDGTVSKYFDINDLLKAVIPLFGKYKLLLLQPIVKNEVFAIIQDTESEGRVVSSIPLPEIDNPQKVGGAITYYRRYALVSILGLQADDDDGNVASGKTTPNVVKSKPKTNQYNYNNQLQNVKF